MTLRFAILREGRFWIAQGLEHDIGVQGENLRDLLERLCIALDLEGDILGDLPPAPKYFQDLWPLKAGVLQADGLPAGIELGLVA